MYEVKFHNLEPNNRVVIIKVDYDERAYVSGYVLDENGAGYKNHSNAINASVVEGLRVLITHFQSIHKDNRLEYVAVVDQTLGQSEAFSDLMLDLGLYCLPYDSLHETTKKPSQCMARKALL